MNEVANHDSTIATEDTIPYDVPDPPDDTFQVVDAESANWVVKRIQSARAYAERCKLWADAEIRRAEREEEFFWFRFGEQLRKWTAHEILRQKAKRKSVSLPAGTLGFRSCTAKLVVDDELKVIVWARRELPSAISTVTKIKKSELDEHFEKTGEEPSGAHLEPAKEVFYVR